MSKSKTPRLKETVEEIGQRILLKMKELIDAGFELKIDGMITVPVKYEGGNFRQKPVQAGWEFFPEYVYVGSTGKVIFGMSSPDNEPEYSSSTGMTGKWDTAEFSSKHLDDGFPLLLPKLVEAMLGPEAAKSPKYAYFEDLVEALYVREEVSKKLEMETDTEKMMQHPNYGLF